MKCYKCNKNISKPDPGSISTGYGLDVNRNKICYPCCALGDIEYMHEYGKITLYLGDGIITNWPESLSFPVYCSRKGKHNLAKTRTDVWFHGLDGKIWHGTQYGEFSQLCHCRRTQEKTCTSGPSCPL